MVAVGAVAASATALYNCQMDEIDALLTESRSFPPPLALPKPEAAAPKTTTAPAAAPNTAKPVSP